MVTLPPPSKARDDAGRAVGVSGSLIDRARKVRKDGTPALAKAVEQGRMSVTTPSDSVPVKVPEQNITARDEAGQLTPSQLAMVGDKAREIYDKRAKDMQADGGKQGRSKQLGGEVVKLPPPQKSRDEAGQGQAEGRAGAWSQNAKGDSGKST